MFLHFVIDSPYVNRFIEENEQVTQNNLYVFLGYKDEIKYLNKDKLIIINLPKKRSKKNYIYQYLIFFRKLKKLINKAERIYFHFLSFYDCLILLLCSKKNRTYWLLWGADVYNRIDYNLYDDKTKQIITIPAKKSRFKTKIRDYIESVGIKKITYIGTIIKGDYRLISEKFNIENNRIDFCYANPIKFNENITHRDNFCNLKKVLVGNSGDPSNNHFSVFDSLENYTDVEIVCPLSYGDENYISKVIAYGKQKFGERFIPIIKFMNQAEYRNLLNDITVGIFNHYRQQALGNIFALLVLGKKVYVNEKSPAYSFFVENSIRIGNTENIIKEKRIDLIPYSSEVIEKNRQIIMSLHSDEKSLEYIKNLYK